MKQIYIKILRRERKKKKLSLSTLQYFRVTILYDFSRRPFKIYIETLSQNFFATFNGILI